MKQIYDARDELEAHFVKGLLEQQGIHASVQGESLVGGTLPINELSPGVWVNDDDVERAMPIVAEVRERDKVDDRPEAEETATSSLKCPQCGEVVEGQFEACWKCGSAREGTAYA